MNTLKERIKLLEDRIKSLGFVFEDNMGEYFLTKADPEEDHIARMNFDVDALPNCCGVEELGNLFLTKYKGRDPKIRQARKLFIQWVFLTEKQCRYKETRAKTELLNVKPLIFISNGKDAWKEVEPVVLELQKDFFVVSKTRNPSSGGILTFFSGMYSPDYNK